MIKASVIVPVKNEESCISDLIKSLLSQSLVPDEIIFIDGNSTDKTYDIIHKYSLKSNIIKLYTLPKNEVIGKIAIARNYAVNLAKNDVIVCVDAGCILDKNWFKEMILPFENDYDIVVGCPKGDYSNTFSYNQSLVMINSIVDNNGNIILSRAASRSIAFRKVCWKKVGGYREDTMTSEDTNFNYSLYRQGYKFYYAKDAISYCEMRPSYFTYIKQMFTYGYGDGHTFIFTKMKNSVFLLMISTILLISLLFSLYSLQMFMYLILTIIVSWVLYSSIFYFSKHKQFDLKYNNHFVNIFYVFIFLLIKRVGYIAGLLKGLTYKILGL